MNKSTKMMIACAALDIFAIARFNRSVASRAAASILPFSTSLPSERDGTHVPRERRRTGRRHVDATAADRGMAPSRWPKFQTRRRNR